MKYPCLVLKQFCKTEVHIEIEKAEMSMESLLNLLYGMAYATIRIVERQY